MIDVLKDKKVIFFDVGYTLDYPASGDWMFTKKFYEIVGDRLSRYSFLQAVVLRFCFSSSDLPFLLRFSTQENVYSAKNSEQQYTYSLRVPRHFS